MNGHVKSLVTLTLLASTGVCAREVRAADPNAQACVVASETAVQLAKRHKLRDEREPLTLCASQTCPKAIRNECMALLAEVNRKIPTIIFDARDAAGRDLSAVKVTMNGEVLTEHLDGTALVLDPGEYNFRFEVADHEPVEKQLVVRESEKDRHLEIRFEQLGAPAPAQPPASTLPERPAASIVSPGLEAAPAKGAPERATPTSHSTTPPTASSSKSGATQRTLGWVTLGIGGAGLITSGIAGVLVLARKGQLDDSGECSAHVCSSSQRDITSSYNTMRTLSTAAFVVGVIGAGAGVTLLLTAPKKEQAVTAKLGLGTLSIERSF